MARYSGEVQWRGAAPAMKGGQERVVGAGETTLFRVQTSVSMSKLQKSRCASPSWRSAQRRGVRQPENRAEVLLVPSADDAH